MARKKPLIFIGLLSLVLLTIWMIYIDIPTHQPLATEIIAHIPKQIWTFWNTPNPPELILKCVETWRKFNPIHKVTLLTPLNVQSYLRSVPPFDVDSVMPAHWSDWIRVAIIMEHGGIWMDASMILTTSLENVLRMGLSHELPQRLKEHVWVYSVNSTNRKVPLIDNWFMASPPHSLFITAWFLELSMAMRTIKTYLLDIKTLYGVDVYERLIEGIDKNDEKGVDYFRANVALQKVVQVHGVPLPYVLQAEKGPMKVYSETKWNGILYAEKIVSEPIQSDPGIWKLTHHARDEVLRLLSIGTIHPESIYKLYLG